MKRPSFAAIALIVLAAGFAAAWLTLEWMVPESRSHDDHFAIAMLTVLAFRYATYVVAVTSLIALAVAVTGRLQRDENGVLSATATLVSALLLVAATIALIVQLR